MREGFQKVQCDNAKAQNLTKRFFRIVRSMKHEIRGWEPKNELFDWDGVEITSNSQASEGWVTT
jgi:hypothetical protein